MTPTINREAYSNLLAQYPPKVIETEAENEQMTAIAYKLSQRSELSREESALLDLLIVLIEKFEDEAYPIPEVSPHEMLLHLMDARDCKQEELIGVIGSRGVVSEVVNGKRGISKAQAKSLSEYFGVGVEMFI
ncbi:MAG: transcriptional regulator [Thermosynechococcaceae cyanobacterium]